MKEEQLTNEELQQAILHTAILLKEATIDTALEMLESHLQNLLETQQQRARENEVTTENGFVTYSENKGFGDDTILDELERNVFRTPFPKRYFAEERIFRYNLNLQWQKTEGDPGATTLRDYVSGMIKAKLKK
jgi:hypothetical protein